MEKQRRQKMFRSYQLRNLHKFLEYLETCPCDHSISSMSGGFVHVKFFVPVDRDIEDKNKKE